MIALNEKIVEFKYNQILNVVCSCVGNSTTYGTDLTKFGKELFGKKYIGTFASNEIPKLKNGNYCIVNLDKSYENGSHWIAMVRLSGKDYVYDSFGRKTTEILPDFKEKTIDADYDAEQSITETNCGARCLAFLFFTSRYGIKNALKL